MAGGFDVPNVTHMVNNLWHKSICGASNLNQRKLDNNTKLELLLNTLYVNGNFCNLEFDWKVRKI